MHLTLKRVDCSIERWHIHQSGAVTGSMVDGRFASGVPPLRPVRRTGVDGGAGSELIGVTDGITADADEGRAGATREYRRKRSSLFQSEDRTNLRYHVNTVLIDPAFVRFLNPHGHADVP